MVSPPLQAEHPPTPLLLGLAAPLLALGALLRLWALPAHSNVWAIDWLAYYEPQASALTSLRLHRYVLGWEGLHPPVSGMIHGALMAVGIPLGGHWVATVAATLGGALAGAESLRRFAHQGAAVGWLALAILCVSPLQANYGLNTSPYPWVLLLVAWSGVTTLDFAQRGGLRRAGIAALVCGLAVETHVLAFAVAIAHGLFLLGQGAEFRRTQAGPLRRFFLVLGVLCLPMLLGSLFKTADPWTFHVDGGEPFWRTAEMVVTQRFGDRPAATALGAVGLLLGLIAVARQPRGLPALLGLSLLGWCSALLLFFQIGVADPRLTHYYLVPQLLLVLLGAAGLGAITPTRARSLRWLTLLTGTVLTAVWALGALRWQHERRGQAEAEIGDAAPAPDAVRTIFERAGEGDVVAYLWDHAFLNDEPEYLDPVAARWPVGRLGRRCRGSEVPRGLCNASAGARFYFDPSAFSGPIFELEEPLRLMVNAAHAPGSARLIFLPGPDAPPRPFPAEALLAAWGGVRRELGPRVWVWEFPPGARIAPPSEPLEPPPGWGQEDVPRE